MEYFSKSYNEEEDGFNGNCEAYVVSTKKENLFNWLTKETADANKLYNIIKELTEDILIVKNINVDEEFQGQSNGSQILCDLINNSFASSAILVCDIGESQKEGFVLEEFYENHDFKTIQINSDYPLMVYPTSLADKIIAKLNSENTSKPKL